MNTHVTTERGAARPDTDQHSLASGRATDSQAQPGQGRVWQEGHLAARTSPRPTESGETQPPGLADVHIGSASAIAAGAVLLIGVALFTAGVLRPQIERAIQRIILRAEDIRLPAGIPRVVLETLREMRADMDTVSAMSDDLRAGR
jgi:hypothetical protein